MKWNAVLYDNKHEFVSKYGKVLIDLVNTSKDQVILDLGCGTGKLSVELAKNGAKVIGIDMSKDMLEKAKLNYPTIEFNFADATELNYENYFDTVFSNAVLHWIKDHRKLLKSVYKALKTKGKLICEFGADRCAYHIQSAFKEVYENLGYTYISPFSYKNSEEYRKLLVEIGFKVEKVIDFDRPTPLEDGEKGLRNWITQFYSSNLEHISNEDKEKILSTVEERLRPILFKDGVWIADYRRIQVVAIK